MTGNYEFVVIIIIVFAIVADFGRDDVGVGTRGVRASDFDESRSLVNLEHPIGREAGGACLPRFATIW
jgi:hypothetical protein